MLALFINQGIYSNCFSFSHSFSRAYILDLRMTSRVTFEASTNPTPVFYNNAKAKKGSFFKQSLPDTTKSLQQNSSPKRTSSISGSTRASLDLSSRFRFDLENRQEDEQGNSDECEEDDGGETSQEFSRMVAKAKISSSYSSTEFLPAKSKTTPASIYDPAFSPSDISTPLTAVATTATIKEKVDRAKEILIEQIQQAMSIDDEGDFSSSEEGSRVMAITCRIYLCPYLYIHLIGGRGGEQQPPQPPQQQQQQNSFSR